MQFTRSLALLGVLSCTSAEVLADDSIQLPAGSKVRVTVATGREGLMGKVVALDDKTLTIEIAGQTDATVLRRGDITTVAVSLGHRSRGRGALIGAGAGAAAGMLIGHASGSDPAGIVPFSAGDKALLGALALAPLGALIGLAIPPSERWKAVPLDRIRLGVHPAPGHGLEVSFSLTF